MRVVVDRKALYGATSQLVKVVKGSVLPFLHLRTVGDEVVLEGVSADVSLRQSVAARVEAPGEAAFNGEGFAKLLRSCTAYSLLTLEGPVDGYLRVVGGHTEAKLTVMDVADLPPFPTLTGNQEWKFPAVAFGQALARLLPIAVRAPADFRGVMLEPEEGRTRLTAVDGTMLAYTHVGVLGCSKVVVPPSVQFIIPELLRCAATDEVTVGVSAGSDVVELRTPSGTTLHVLADTRVETFPDYRCVIPSSPILRLRVNRLALMMAAERCTKFTTDQNHTVSMVVNGATLVMEAKRFDSLEILREEVPVDMENEWLRLGVNAKLLCTALALTQGEDVEMRREGGHLGVVMWKIDEVGGCVLVMPLRLN